MNDEHARTLLLYATCLEERGLEPQPPPALVAAGGANAPPAATAPARTAPALLHEAGRRFIAAGNTTAAGDAFYRLGALECRRFLREPNAAAAPPIPAMNARPAMEGGSDAATDANGSHGTDGSSGGGRGGAAASGEERAVMSTCMRASEATAAWVAAAAGRLAPSLAAAQAHFERALELLPPGTHASH